jgi:hypothetical protein
MVVSMIVSMVVSTQGHLSSTTLYYFSVTSPSLKAMGYLLSMFLTLC